MKSRLKPHGLSPRTSEDVSGSEQTLYAPPSTLHLRVSGFLGECLPLITSRSIEEIALPNTGPPLVEVLDAAIYATSLGVSPVKG